MSDIVEKLRAGEICSEISAEYACGVKNAASGCQCATAADRIEQLESDLSDALTDLNTAQQDNASCTVVIHNQADRIEKLEAALREIVAMDEVAIVEFKKGDGWLHQRVARAALEKST